VEISPIFANVVVSWHNARNHSVNCTST